MNRFIFVCILFCGATGFNDFSGSISNASTSLSEGVHTAKDVFDINRELNEIRQNKKPFGRKRPRRFSESSNRDPTSALNKITAGVGAFLKTYLYQPIAHGNFQESTIRAYNMLSDREGKFVFGELNGDLDQSFRSLMRDRHRRTGDIISCRIPTDRMAEHYMMVINNKIIEVGVVGGKSTNNGFITIDSYRKSSYINSTECLYHQNRLILRAEQVDERNGDDRLTDLFYREILERVNCTVGGGSSGRFRYDVMTCNCQDLVLFWAYGYMENNCVAASFSGCPQRLVNTLYQISRFVDESGEFQRQADADSMAILNAAGISAG